MKFEFKDRTIYINEDVYDDYKIEQYEIILQEYIERAFFEGFEDESQFKILNRCYLELNHILKSFNNMRKNIEDALKSEAKFLDSCNKKTPFWVLKSAKEKVFNLESKKQYLLKYYCLYEDLKIRFESLLNDLNGQIYYIYKNTSLLPLVFANDIYKKAKPFSKMSNMFYCQFHNEKTPSFGVSMENHFICFGCGAQGSQFQYIMKYENLTYEDAVYLIAEIYMIELPNNPYKKHELVYKYQSVLVSDEYMEILLKSYQRAKNRNEDDNILKLYVKHLRHIERIKKGEVDLTLIAKKDKIYKLEIPENM